MSSINRLNKVSELAAGDLIPLFSQTLGDDAAATLATLTAYLQEQLTADSGKTTQYAAPNATGFGVLITPPVNGGSVWLLLTPAAGYAAGTIALPPSTTCVDGQEVQISCTQSVTTLTTTGNGSTVNGAPTTLAANSFFTLRFDGVLKAWYRVA